MSQLIKFTMFILALFAGTLLALERAPMQMKNLPFKDSIKKRVESGDVYTESVVKSYEENEKKMQELHFKIAGLHPKDCKFALRKLSQYENYKDYLGFVKMSTYDEKKGKVYFIISSDILPFQMGLNFKIPRITAPGVYPFSFDMGFLSGLQGEIQVAEEKNQCLFFTFADWKGPHTSFPDMVFEFFSKALSQMSMEKLIQISKTY